MNLVEKKRCLYCGEVVRHIDDTRVMANVLVAHARCIPGGEQ
jgi:hypothetical protein